MHRAVFRTEPSLRSRSITDRNIRVSQLRFCRLVAFVVLNLLLGLPGIMVVMLIGCEGAPNLVDSPGTAESHAVKSPENGEERSLDLLTEKDPIGIQTIFVPAGEFLMGSDAPERFGELSRSEALLHRVRITQSFYMSRTEVTVVQFRRFVEDSGYVTDAERLGTGCNGLVLPSGEVRRDPQWIWSSPGFFQTDQHPVVCVSWQDAIAFCGWLSDLTQQRYRLPTEAEWEYACRAGTNSLFSTGDKLESLEGFVNCGDRSLADVFPAACPAVVKWNDGFPFTSPTGSFKPNPWDFCDMHGNVGEWCMDWFDPQYYSDSPVDDPAGPVEPQRWRVVRGGSWYNGAASCRSSGRHDGVPTEASTTNGFRVVKEIPNGIGYIDGARSRAESAH